VLGLVLGIRPVRQEPPGLIDGLINRLVNQALPPTPFEMKRQLHDLEPQQTSAKACG
jgi:hypothetical protein